MDCWRTGTSAWKLGRQKASTVQVPRMRDGELRMTQDDREPERVDPTDEQLEAMLSGDENEPSE